MFGKGPSFEARKRYDLSEFNLFGLNHVVREQPLLIAHAIDMEVVFHCADALLANARYVLMPWVPHVRYQPLSIRRRVAFKPGERTLLDWTRENPVLGRLEEEGRLLTYDLLTGGNRRYGVGPVIYAHSFSATAGLNLLAAAGARKVCSLGIDGGQGYAGNFSDLRKVTHLVGGQSSFSVQFQSIARTIMETGIDFHPLDIEAPIRVYVGAEPEQELAFKVLEYSVHKHTSMSVKVEPLYQAVREGGIDVPTPRTPALRPRTPFTYQRFAIPGLKDYKGRAIYLDSDMLVFRDLRELWTWPLDGNQILSVKEPEGSGRRPQFSVMVLDCQSLDWKVGDLIGQLDQGKWSYEQFVFEMAAAKKISAVLPSGWNDLERYQPGETALTHYTDMSTQPWLTTENLLGRIWCEALFEAVEKGFIKREFIVEQVERGWVRPSLLDQLDMRIVDPLLLPRASLRKDAQNFVPPHRFRKVLRPLTGYGSRKITTSQRIGRSAYARARDIWFRSGADKIVRKIRNRLGSR